MAWVDDLPIQVIPSMKGYTFKYKTVEHTYDHNERTSGMKEFKEFLKESIQNVTN